MHERGRTLQAERLRRNGKPNLLRIGGRLARPPEQHRRSDSGHRGILQRLRAGTRGRHVGEFRHAPLAARAVPVVLVDRGVPVRHEGREDFRESGVLHLPVPLRRFDGAGHTGVPPGRRRGRNTAVLDTAVGHDARRDHVGKRGFPDVLFLRNRVRVAGNFGVVQRLQEQLPEGRFDRDGRQRVHVDLRGFRHFFHDRFLGASAGHAARRGGHRRARFGIRGVPGGHTALAPPHVLGNRFLLHAVHLGPQQPVRRSRGGQHGHPRQVAAPQEEADLHPGPRVHLLLRDGDTDVLPGRHLPLHVAGVEHRFLGHHAHRVGPGGRVRLGLRVQSFPLEYGGHGDGAEEILALVLVAAVGRHHTCRVDRKLRESARI